MGGVQRKRGRAGRSNAVLGKSLRTSYAYTVELSLIFTGQHPRGLGGDTRPPGSTFDATASPARSSAITPSRAAPHDRYRSCEARGDPPDPPRSHHRQPAVEEIQEIPHPLR